METGHKRFNGNIKIFGTNGMRWDQRVKQHGINVFYEFNPTSDDAQSDLESILSFRKTQLQNL
jgi:hypothetical protein